MKNYQEIGEYFERSTEGENISASFKNAIQIMRTKPEWPPKLAAWDEMLWLCVEEYLNDGKNNKSDEDEIFIRACALLEG